ncbi:hypothetical protein BGZ73_002097 [Actinomortierella ambigua]|nr:hypothetical protein BGZ73_002097 [Actinomortierella ambigua]
MRLRARLHRDFVFFKLVQAMEKIGKTCFIKFTPSIVAFGAASGMLDTNEEGGGGSVQCWARINREHIFREYRIESVINNEIYVEMRVDELTHVLRSCALATDATMKMTGRSSAASLSFTIKTGEGSSRIITHDVPILRVMSREGAEHTKAFEEPMIPDPDVHIMLPPLDILRNVTSTYKSLANYVILSANLMGEMTLITTDGAMAILEDESMDTGHAQSTMPGSGTQRRPTGTQPTMRNMTAKAQVETVFKNLLNPVLVDDPIEDLDNPEANVHPQNERRLNRPHEFARAMIRIGDLQKVLQSHYIKPHRVICCLIPNQAVLFYVYLQDVEDAALTYYIPVAAGY